MIPVRKLENARRLVAIHAVHERGCGNYDPKKIQTELAPQGLGACVNRIERLRKLHGIRCTRSQQFRVVTDSKHQLPVAAIKDLYRCEIVGWSMDKLMTEQLVIDALRAAYWR